MYISRLWLSLAGASISLLEITAASRLSKRTLECSTFYGAPAKDQCLEALEEMPDNLLSRPDEVAFVPKDTVLAGRQGLPQLWQRVDFGNPEAESCIISLRFASHVEDVRDVDTWRNIRSVATQIIDQCIGIPATGAPRGKGGGESCGQNGNMYVAVYAWQSAVYKYPDGIPLVNADTFWRTEIGSQSGASNLPQWPEACVGDPSCMSGDCDLYPVQNAIMYGASTLSLEAIGTCLASAISRRKNLDEIERVGLRQAP